MSHPRETYSQLTTTREPRHVSHVRDACSRWQPRVRSAPWTAQRADRRTGQDKWRLKSNLWAHPCCAPECNDYDFDCDAPALQQVVVHLPHAKPDRVPDAAFEAKSSKGSDRNFSGKSVNAGSSPTRFCLRSTLAFSGTDARLKPLVRSRLFIEATGRAAQALKTTGDANQTASVHPGDVWNNTKKRGERGVSKA